MRVASPTAIAFTTSQIVLITDAGSAFTVVGALLAVRNGVAVDTFLAGGVVVES